LYNSFFNNCSCFSYLLIYLVLNVFN